MSLRARLLVGMAVIAAVLAAAAIVIAQRTEDHLLHQVDAQLAAAEPRLRESDDHLGPPGGPPPEGISSAEQLSSFYVGVVYEADTIVTLFSANLSGAAALPALEVADVLAHADAGETFTVGSDDADLRYRALARHDERRGFVYVIALPLDDVDAAVSRLVAVEIVATLAVLGVLALVTWWVIRLGVRPVKQMTATARAIADGDLTQRVPDVAAGTEAGELGTALNRMLGHIEAAFAERTRSEDRLRQFVADASHELRTPVTTIRGYAELYRAGGLSNEDDLTEAMRRTEDEAIRMGALVEDLLLLARLDQGRPLQLEPVELRTLATEAVRDAQAVDPTRPITATTDGPIMVIGDESRLRQVVGNLLGNALVHTPPGTPVDVRVGRRGGSAVLEVRDAGPGMAADVAARAFERFFRADPSRSRHRGGTGLGLAIVQATVGAHGGTVALETAPGEGTTVRVELPIAASTPE